MWYEKAKEEGLSDEEIERIARRIAGEKVKKEKKGKEKYGAQDIMQTTVINGGVIGF